MRVGKCGFKLADMEWDTYRSEFAAHREAQARALYERHAGLPLSVPPTVTDERFSDLWQLANLNARAQEFSEATFFTETEQRGDGALLNALRMDYVRTQTSALAAEIGRYDNAMRLSWPEHDITAHNFTTAIAQETRAATRQELALRWAEQIHGGNDLRAALWHERQEAVRVLGYAGGGEFYEALSGTNLTDLARSAGSFLQTTEAVYRAELARLTPQWRPDEARPQLTWADWLFWINQPLAHPAFPAHDLLPAYSDVVRGLGWRAGPQSNLIFDTIARTGKSAATACYGVRPPTEVRVTCVPATGVKSYRAFFAAAGRAQHQAWTARDWLARQPALVFTPDTALNEGYAALWGGLLGDAGWLCEYRAGLAPEAAHALARAEAFRLLAQTRRDCALLLYELACYAADGPDEALIQQMYVGGLREATGFVPEAVWAGAASDAPLACATRLRGVLLATMLGEYLRVHYGRRWWAVRRAGDDLVDWWNTGSRYHAEELAPLVGAGALSFELLADNLLSAVRAKP